MSNQTNNHDAPTQPTASSIESSVWAQEALECYARNKAKRVHAYAKILTNIGISTNQAIAAAAEILEYEHDGYESFRHEEAYHRAWNLASAFSKLTGIDQSALSGWLDGELCDDDPDIHAHVTAVTAQLQDRLHWRERAEKAEYELVKIREVMSGAELAQPDYSAQSTEAEREAERAARVDTYRNAARVMLESD